VKRLEPGLIGPANPDVEHRGVIGPCYKLGLMTSRVGWALGRVPSASCGAEGEGTTWSAIDITRPMCCRPATRVHVWRSARNEADGFQSPEKWDVLVVRPPGARRAAGSRMEATPAQFDPLGCRRAGRHNGMGDVFEVEIGKVSCDLSVDLGFAAANRGELQRVEDECPRSRMVRSDVVPHGKGWNGARSEGAAIPSRRSVGDGQMLAPHQIVAGARLIQPRAKGEQRSLAGAVRPIRPRMAPCESKGHAFSTRCCRRTRR